MKVNAVILAAGQGTRLHSKLPKVLHPILGRPLAWHALQSVKQVTGIEPVMIVGHGAEQVRVVLDGEAQFVLQEPQLGTGHAVQQAAPLLQEEPGLVLVTYADMPLLKPETLSKLVEAQKTHDGPFTFLSVSANDPRGFGRVIRDGNGHVKAIVEEAVATPEQLQVRELNASVYCFSSDWLWTALERIPLSPKGEYYLTDLVEIATSDNLSVKAICVEESPELIGINTRVHLAEAEQALRKWTNEQWMLAGVTLIDPTSTYIEVGVEIGQDTVIWPNTYLQGSTVIGEGCEIGPNSIIRSTRIGSQCRVISSVLEFAVLEDHVEMGPFGHLRKGAHLAEGVHMGNFGEVKNSYLGPGTKMGHFSYLGDANIGTNVNIGAGTITCNFDGEHKHKTEIGADVFIGSDTMLVAPVKLGEGSRTGAGAVVTKDIQPHSLAVGVPARTIRKLKKSD